MDEREGVTLEPGTDNVEGMGEGGSSETGDGSGGGVLPLPFHRPKRRHYLFPIWQTTVRDQASLILLFIFQRSEKIGKKWIIII